VQPFQIEKGLGTNQNKGKPDQSLFNRKKIDAVDP
jgi:hypothetical protein